MEFSVTVGNGLTICQVCRKMVRAGQRILKIRYASAGKPYSPVIHIHSDPEDCHENRLKHPFNLYRYVSAVDAAKRKLGKSKQADGNKWRRKPVPVDYA